MKNIKGDVWYTLYSQGTHGLCEDLGRLVGCPVVNGIWERVWDRVGSPVGGQVSDDIDRQR